MTLDQTVPDQTVPDQTVPDQTVPDRTVPDQTVPDQTVPDRTVPDRTAAGERIAGIVTGTTPYPWPYDGALAVGRTALIVAGWNDEWWARCHEPSHVVGPIGRLAGAVDTVITIDHGGPSRSTYAGNSAGGTVPTIAGSRAVAAAGIDAFFGGPLDPVLRSCGADLLLLVGLGLEATVHSTMRSANDRGYECLLVLDACAPLDPDSVPNAVSMVEMSGGIFGAVGLTEPVLAALDAAR
jgi:biuret amidohydrolase